MRARPVHRSLVRSLISSGLACGLCLLVASTTQAQIGGGTATGGTGGTGTGGTGAGGGQPNFAAPQLLTVGDSIDATGGTGFAGRGAASETFVGGGVQATQGQGGANQFGGGAGGRNQFSTLNRGQGQTGRGQQPTGPSRSERVRPRYRIAFPYTRAQNTAVATQLRTRLSSLATRLPAMSGVLVSLDAQGNATLTGTTASADSARLAAALARLEPGVRRVDNQLQVSSAN